MQSFRFNIITLLLIGFMCCTYAFYNKMKYFKYLQSRCFNGTAQKNGFLISGQQYPLSHTFENFLSLVEKFEAANPEMKLEDMLHVLLRNFTHENMAYREDGFIQNQPLGSKYGFIENLWEKDRTGQLPAHENPFDDNEMCSLFYMLSHTVTDVALMNDEQPRIYSTASTISPPTPEASRSLVFSKDRMARADMPRTENPRELGIVLIRPFDETVALSQVILGLFLGITGTEVPLGSLITKSDEDENKNFKVSPLHILTLADTLLLSKWSQFTVKIAKEFGGEVTYRGINNQDVGMNTDIICPTVFQLGTNQTSMFTYSLIRGSTDGLLLGSIVKNIHDSHADLRLSQVLRSYYSPLGIQVSPSANGNSGALRYSSCDRSSLLDLEYESVKEHMKALLEIISDEYPANEVQLTHASEDFENKKKEIFKANTDYCTKPIAVDDLNCETPVDVLIVLDTTNGMEEIKLQQQIIGYMATELQLWNGGSTATVYLDQLNDSSTSLAEMIPQTYSSACIACHVVQKEITSGNVDRKVVLQAIDKILEEKKEKDKALSGALGKIVVYFNFKDSEAPDSRLDQILYHLYRAHSDVPFIVVGKNENVLKKYAGQNKFSIIRLVSNEDTKKEGINLAQKICLGPASFQYGDCKVARDERNAIYEGHVTKKFVQHWGMDAKYFEKSFTAKFFFEATDGNIKVCHNRATTKPELVEKNCQKTNTSSRRLQFTETDPCKGLSGFSCPPSYFSVIGVVDKENGNNLNDYKCTEPGCKSLNQVKFKFSHEGVRCSGCVGLLSNSILLIISAISAYFLLSK